MKRKRKVVDRAVLQHYSPLYPHLFLLIRDGRYKDHSVTVSNTRNTVRNLHKWLTYVLSLS